MKFISNVSKVFFGKYLIVTNTITTSTLLATGDCIQQRIEIHSNHHPYNISRTCNMFATGLLLGPLAHGFYKVLDKRFPAQNVRTVIKKIIIEQTLAAPPFLFIFFMSCGILDGFTIKQSYEELKAKFLIMYKLDCMIWPPSQFINFLYLHPKYRVLYVSMIAMFYDILLSSVKYNM